ncbi:hypothetical protein [Bacterioplanoides sp.]|uniref:hypothetical protein n=1 Tax=Bacterioplanoides sp. TaxID=2066072 RepID=UPI003B00A309
MITKLRNIAAGFVLVVVSSVASAATFQFSPDPFVLDYTSGTPVELSVSNFPDPIGAAATNFTVAQDLTTTIWNFTFDDDGTPAESLQVILLDAANQLVFDSGVVTPSPLSFTINSLLAGEYTLQIFSDSEDVNGSISAVPVPAAVLLFGTALLGFAGFSARRKV